LNNGNGNFTPSENTFVGLYFSDLAVADVDGDGKSDFVVSGTSEDAYVYMQLFHNIGDGMFVEVEDIPFFAIEDGSIVFSDINGDQIPDFILTGSYNFSLYTKVYINNSDQMKINDWNKNNLSIYPNPVKNILNIDSDDTILGVKIYNMTGQELKNVKADSKNAKIDMEGIHSGVYIFKVQTSKELKSFKVIKL